MNKPSPCRGCLEEQRLLGREPPWRLPCTHCRTCLPAAGTSPLSHLLGPVITDGFHGCWLSSAEENWKRCVTSQRCTRQTVMPLLLTEKLLERRRNVELQNVFVEKLQQVWIHPNNTFSITYPAGLQEPITAIYTVKAELHPGHVACSLQDLTESDEAHNGQFEGALIGWVYWHWIITCPAQLITDEFNDGSKFNLALSVNSGCHQAKAIKRSI